MTYLSPAGGSVSPSPAPLSRQVLDQQVARRRARLVALEAEMIAACEAAANKGSSIIPDPSSINHSRYAAIGARPAQLTATVSADALIEPTPILRSGANGTDHRLLSDIRRIAETIAGTAARHYPASPCCR